MIVIIDGTKIRSERDLHEILMHELKFGDFYGHNSAALWDRLTTDVERSVKIVWEHSEQSRVALGNEMFSKYVRLFNDVVEQDALHELDNRLEFMCK
jgi:ribonuclease inhibitor